MRFLFGLQYYMYFLKLCPKRFFRGSHGSSGRLEQDKLDSCTGGSNNNFDLPKNTHLNKCNISRLWVVTLNRKKRNQREKIQISFWSMRKKAVYN